MSTGARKPDLADAAYIYQWLACVPVLRYRPHELARRDRSIGKIGSIRCVSCRRITVSDTEWWCSSVFSHNLTLR